MTDDSGVASSDAQQVLLTGEKAKSCHGRAAGPPSRPPPPRTSGSQMSSPAQGVVKPTPPKSAFDDLDNSIREAFGGSPSKSFASQGGSAVAGGWDHQQPVAGLFGSSSQQHAFALNTQMFSSPVKGVPSVDSVAAIGGGSH